MTLTEALHGPRVLVMDAAMGTALLAAGVLSVNAAPLTHPEAVRAIHRAHVAAGAEVVLTATFQHNRAALGREGLLKRRDRLIEAASEQAWSAGARYILADFGPMYAGGGEELDGDNLARALTPLNPADGYLLETWSSPAVLAAAGYLADLPEPFRQPTLVSLAYHRQGDALLTHSGHPPEYFARAARRHGVAALGVNCGRDIGLRDIVEVLRRYRDETDLPLFARPNAGTPRADGTYPLTPEELADAVPAMVAAGARMIGGCCGTTAEHIRGIADFGLQIAD